jgi:Glycosyl transferase family 2
VGFRRVSARRSAGTPADGTSCGPATLNGVGAADVRIVGSVLVRNEDVFVEQAIRNIADFCDEIHAVDHVSTDGTWPLLEGLARELDNLHVQRSKNSAAAQQALEPYAGTPTWVLGVDGDELYDPAGLAVLREQLSEGEHADVFRLKAHVLNCDDLDRERRTAHGYLSPPSRPITKLFNFGAVESWTGTPDPLQAGEVRFREGFDWESRRDLTEETTWDDDPLRCLHVCFLRRSKQDPDRPVSRVSLTESREFRRGWVGTVLRKFRKPVPAPEIEKLQRRGLNWKRQWYALGEPVSVDATPFLAAH